MMQSQGLGALMPQDAQQMAPQQPPMDPQRLAAATNLVSSDAERQVLDPRTLALIKYKDAVAAMQAADELMAASQPAPTPPTVAERVQQSAQEGIMGLASRLGAGIQQQGSNMQAEQMQQAMSGGLPQLPAPNMAGMAQGGIVGFDVGGGVGDNPLDPLTPEMRAEVETILSGRPPSPESARSGAYTGPTSAERRAETAERTEGSLRRIEQNAEQRRAGNSLRQYLRSEGLTVPEIDQMIAAQRLPEEELESAEVSSGLPDVLSAITQDAAQPRFLPEQSQSSAPDRGPVRQIPENELAQIEAEIESDPNAFERLASWVAENPYDAISMGLIAVPGIGLAGSLSMRIGGALMRSPAVSRAVQSLYTRPNPAVTRGPGFTVRDPNMPSRVGAPGRAISVGSGVAGTGMMLGGGGDGEGIASLPIGPTEETTRAEAPVTSAADAQAQAAAPAEVSQDAVETLLEQEQQPRAGESAADRDARMRRLIAGLRGFGAQGLGGFAAGSSAEELRQEQALIAEQERERGREDAALGRDVQREQIAMQETVARMQAEAGQFAQSINILTRAGRTEEEALREIAAMTQRAQADPADARWQNAVNTAYEQITTNPSLMALPEEARFAAARRLAVEIYNTSMSRPSAGGGDTGFEGETNDDLFNFGN